MANFVFVDPIMGVVPMTATATSRQFELGFQVKARDVGALPGTGTAQSVSVNSAWNGAGIFQYVKGFSVSQPQSQGQLVALVAGSAALAQSGNTGTLYQGPYGIAAGAISASTVYGWVQVQGYCDYARGHTAGDFALGAKVHIGTTAGALQSTAGATGYLVQNINFASAGSSVGNSTNQTVFLQFPFFYGV